MDYKVIIINYFNSEKKDCYLEIPIINEITDKGKKIGYIESKIT